MSGSRRLVPLVLALTAVPTAGALAGVDGPQRQLSRPAAGDTRLPAVAATPDGRRALVAWAREFSPTTSSGQSEVYARLVDRRGRPLGRQVRVSQMGPEGRRGYGVEAPDVAYDPRRRRYLVVWTGNGSSEAIAPCRGPSASPSCRESDVEVYARVLDERGRPIGPQRRITNTGPRNSVAFQAHQARVVHHPRNREFLVSYNAGPRGLPDRAEIHVQRIDARGREVGADDRRITRLGRGVALGAVAPARRSGGYLLAYTWIDPAPAGAEVYARRLDARGAPRGRAVALSRRGGARESLADVATGPRDGYAVAVQTLTGTAPFSRTTVVPLRADGRPAGRARAVPGADITINAGLVLAPDARSGGWLAAYIAETSRDREVEAVRLDRRGRPRGRAFQVSRMGGSLRNPRSERGEAATMPALAALGGGGSFLAAWAGVDSDDRERQEIYARALRR